MVQELNLTLGQTIILLAILLYINILITRYKKQITLDIKKPPEVENEKVLRNNNFGAYLQNYNKYYN